VKKLGPLTPEFLVSGLKTRSQMSGPCQLQYMCNYTVCATVCSMALWMCGCKCVSVNQHVCVYVAHLTLSISLSLCIYSNNNTQSSTFVLGISLSFSHYLSLSLSPSLHVSLCISIISWYQSVEFLSLSFSISPVFLSRVSL
jgi:hypothetical protein